MEKLSVFILFVGISFSMDAQEQFLFQLDSYQPVENNDGSLGSQIKMPLADGGDGALDLVQHYLKAETKLKLRQKPLLWEVWVKCWDADRGLPVFVTSRIIAGKIRFPQN